MINLPDLHLPDVLITPRLPIHLQHNPARVAQARGRATDLIRKLRRTTTGAVLPTEFTPESKGLGALHIRYGRRECLASNPENALRFLQQSGAIPTRR